MAYGNDPGDDLMPTPQQLAEYQTKATQAQKVTCRQCGAQPNEPCRNKITGHPLRKIAIHPIRITDGKTIVQFTTTDAEELF